MKDRILQVMDHEGLTPSKFAEKIGIQRSAMSHIISGRNNPSLDVFLKVLETFPYVDTEWLLYGKGEMMRRDLKNETSLFTETEKNESERSCSPENGRNLAVDTTVNMPKYQEYECVMHQNSTDKSITKIMVFYSDNTFDTFIKEKSSQE